MNTLRRFRAHTVLAAPLMALGLLAGGGCRTVPWDDTAGAAQVQVINRTENTVRASLHLAERREGRDGANLIRRGELETIWRKNAEALDVPQPREFLGTRDPGSDYVIWLRIEPVTPSWKERPVHWYEFLGPPPKKVTISERTRRDETHIIVLADEVIAEPVPYQYWPVSDMTFAENGP
ncbi:MAG: hypothetical protein ACF8Q5_10520 [Phycisphaerales bacterium JB040]